MGSLPSKAEADECFSGGRNINTKTSAFRDSTSRKPQPSRKPSWGRESPKNFTFRLDEFLFNVFEWRPEWLKDPQYNNRTPPIVDPRTVISTSLNYETIEDYCEAMLPLLLLEFWHVLKKDGDEKRGEAGKGTKKKEEVVKTITTDAAVKSQLTGHFFYLTVGAGRFESDNYPNRGDLVSVQYDRGNIFGYVEDRIRARDAILRARDAILRPLYTYRIKTRMIAGSVTGTVTLTTVVPLGPYLRFVRAMDDLSQSPLFHSVMKPKVEDYEMLDAELSSVFPLATGHVLNAKQQEVVARVVETVKQRCPKICLIQGPPGTGKSKVILNVICEVLKKPNTQILLCAPSNRAIDEVVGNLIAVQKERSDKMEAFTIVRIGREEKMGAEVQEVTLSFHSRMSALKLGPDKRAAEAKILAEADVIATTLSSCYTFQMESLFGRNGPKIPVCIVDEAAQSSELGTLIPLMLGVSTLILVGDPKQLPPTVLSEEAKFHGFDESLFYRAKKNFELQHGNPVLMLDTQYRMKYDIVRWPNNFFYQGLLKTGSVVPQLPFHNYKVMHHSSHQDQNDSNMGEARLVVNLIFGMATELVKDPGNENVSIGIITPYRRQRRVILELLKARYEKYAPKPKIVQIAKGKNNRVKGSGKANGNGNANFEEKAITLTDGCANDSWEELLEVELQESMLRVQKVEKKEKVDEEREGGSSDDEKENKEGKDEKGGKGLKKKEKMEEKVEMEEPSPLYLKLKAIQVNTVDSFQGQERDIIVMSCVRSRGIGFVNDPNRLCVSLTRARHTMILCGNFNTFKRNSMWKALLADAEARKVYAKVDADASVDDVMKHVIPRVVAADSTDYFLF